MVGSLLDDIQRCCLTYPLEVLLTLNLDEILPFATERFSFPLQVIRNAKAMGFAANHNQAYAHANGQYFCVMNPDLRLKDDPFPALLACLEDASVGVAAPLVLSAKGGIEDSARRFPGPCTIVCKAFGGCRGSDYAVEEAVIHPDWVGGMFMLFPRGVFESLGGFDRRYFLYYEDVDICARLRMQGYEVALNPKARVVHLAHRSSHRNFRYLRWHLCSMLRFFLSPGCRQMKRRK